MSNVIRVDFRDNGKRSLAIDRAREDAEIIFFTGIQYVHGEYVPPESETVSLRKDIRKSGAGKGSNMPARRKSGQ